MIDPVPDEDPPLIFTDEAELEWIRSYNRHSRVSCHVDLPPSTPAQQAAAQAERDAYAALRDGLAAEGRLFLETNFAGQVVWLLPGGQQLSHGSGDALAEAADQAATDGTAPLLTPAGALTEAGFAWLEARRRAEGSSFETARGSILRAARRAAPPGARFVLIAPPDDDE